MYVNIYVCVNNIHTVYMYVQLIGLKNVFRGYLVFASVTFSNLEALKRILTIILWLKHHHICHQIKYEVGGERRGGSGRICLICLHIGSVLYSLELGIADVMISHIVMTTSEFSHLPSLRLESISLPQVCQQFPPCVMCTMCTR